MALAAVPTTEARPAAADPRREYIAAGGFLWLPAALRALPRFIDDVTRDFGRDLYERMAWDPAVQSATRLLRESAIAAPVHAPPTVDGEIVGSEHPEFAVADRIATFCRRNLSRVRPALADVLYELSEAVLEGHRLAEAVYTLTTLDPAVGPQLVLTALKTKPPERYAFVVDPYNNQVGVVYAAPGQPLAVGPLPAPVEGQPTPLPPNFLPRSKYVLYTHWPAYNDPRGRSIARSAYHAWWFKKQTWVEYLRYLATFASAMLFGRVAEGAQPDANGVSAEQAMLTSLLEMRNGGVAVGPHGSDLTPIQVQGEGRAFLAAIDLANHEITLGILMATRATMEAEHGSRADSGTAQDVVELGVAALRSDLADVVAWDICAPLITANYGAAALRYLPLVSLGSTERHDFSSEATAMAAIAKTPIIHWSMLPGVRSRLNLPPADEAAEAADRDRSAALADRLTEAPAPTDQPDTPPGEPPPPPQKGPARNA